MAGRHEAPSRSSFYISLATAVLRGALVVAALALGVFVLSKAFPQPDEASVPVSPEGTVETTVAPPPTTPATTPPDGGGGGGGGGGGDQPREPSEVELQVLNGTDVSGLADSTRMRLEEAGYTVLSIGNAQGGPYDVTRISYKRKAQADAELLRDEFFPGAELEQAAPDAQAEVTVIVGEDYAAQQGEEA